MKFLVLGCNGMAGHMISGYLSERGHEVVGFDRAPSKYIKSFAGDATDPATLDALVLGDKYDSVINCIGILNAAAENMLATKGLLEAYVAD